MYLPYVVPLLNCVTLLQLFFGSVLGSWSCQVVRIGVNHRSTFRHLAAWNHRSSGRLKNANMEPSHQSSRCGVTCRCRRRFCCSGIGLIRGCVGGNRPERNFAIILGPIIFRQKPLCSIARDSDRRLRHDRIGGRRAGRGRKGNSRVVGQRRLGSLAPRLG